MAKGKKPLPGGRNSAQATALAQPDALLAKGAFGELREECSRLLTKYPEHPGLLHKLGIALEKLRDHAQAKETLLLAAKLSPGDARIHSDLGIVLEGLGEFPAAEAAYKQALALAPNLAAAHSNLSDLLLKQKQPDEAIRHARAATKLRPSSPLAWQALGDALLMYGKTDEAIEAFEKATRLIPPQGKAFSALARAYFERNKKEEAMAVLQKARSLIGDDPKILNDLGLTLGSQKRYEEAQALFEAAYKALHEPATMFNILTNLAYMKREAEIFALANEVLSLPQPNVALVPLFGRASQDCQWDLQERLLPHFLKWCEVDDDRRTVAGHNLLLVLPIVAVTPIMVRNIAEKVAATHRQGIKHYRLDITHQKAFENSPKLRIGYLSADFKLHVVNYFISGQLSHYDKQHFEVVCYSNLAEAEEDEITAQYHGAVDKFVRVADMDNATLARRIADDGIHILVDLSGYTGGSRLSVMYHKPAPVQCTYIGYPFTTGISEVDYAFSDPWMNGPENPDTFVEKILEIPHAYVSSGELPVTPRTDVPPVCRYGRITFGSLGNCYKLNRQTVSAWSRILERVPGSRVILNNPRYESALTQESVLKEFGANGIPRDRVTIITEGHPDGRHFYWYEDIDIALDAFPQTGGTTTYESLWMGVPVISLVGSSHYQRLSYSYLKNCGTEVDDLIAFDVDEYIDRAVALANNRTRLEELHRILPINIHHALLCDPARQVRYYEEALIEGWNRKFPDRPKFTPGTFDYVRLNSPAAPWVATVADPGNLYRYVVQEQGRWFAPEYGMLEKLARHLEGQAVEIGSEPGFFSLELAQSGLSTMVLSTSTVAGRLIRAAAEKGRLAERVEVRLESARTNLLERATLRNVALLRIGVEANDGQAGPIVKNPGFWRDNSPLVLLSVHNGDQTDQSVAEKLVAMGYRLYRPLPALDIFAPHDLREPLDPYSLYLLACPPAREEALTRAGLLAQPEPVPPEEAAALAEAARASNPWQRMDEWVTGCADQVHQTLRGAGARLALLQFAIKAQMTLQESAPSTTRRLTLARLFADAGYRSHALSILNQCVGEIEQGSASVTAPFLAPSAAWDAIAPGERLAEWLYAAIIETRCRLAAHSTYFLAEAEFEPLRTLSSLGFETDFSRNALRARSARENQK